MYSQVKLISPDLAQFSVHHKLQLFNTYGTVTPTGRPSKKNFYRPAAKLKHDYKQKNLWYHDFYPKTFSTFLKTKVFIGLL